MQASQVQRARRIARATVYCGGGVGILTALGAGLLLGQARLARHTIPMAESPPPRADGRYGSEFPGEPIRLAVLGDSTGAGLGVDRARDTPAALFAAGLVERLHRPVQVRNVAVSGAESAGLVPQVELAVEWRPDVAVILVGGNDVTHRVRLPVAVGYLGEAVRALRAIGTEVVVGTCPDLGTIRPIHPPLRWLARQWSRELAVAQTVAVVEAGGAAVSLGDLIGPAFYAQPRQMFSADGFHPSAEGYAAAVAAMLPSLIAAMRAPIEERPSLSAADGVRSLAQAAVEAADRAGTEVSPARLNGREHGPAGRWVELRHRVRQLTVRRRDPAPRSAADPVTDELGAA